MKYELANYLLLIEMISLVGGGVAEEYKYDESPE